LTVSPSTTVISRAAAQFLCREESEVITRLEALKKAGDQGGLRLFPAASRMRASSFGPGR
jgi:hypothetical protein